MQQKFTVTTSINTYYDQVEVACLNASLKYQPVLVLGN